jgi:hypothetical protein
MDSESPDRVRRSGGSGFNKDDDGRLGTALKVIGALVGVVGLGFAIGGFFVNQAGIEANEEKIEEERETVFRAYGYVNAREETTHGYGARVILVNESLRPVVVENALLEIEGHRGARVYYYLGDARALARFRLDPGGVEREKELLPLVVDARSARTVGLLLNLAVLNDMKRAKEDVLAAKREFCAIASGKRKRKSLTIRLGLTGGEREEFELDIAGFTESRPPWRASVLGPREAPTAIRLSRRFAEPIAGRVVTMTVWDRRSGRRQRATRPLIGPAAATFPLPELSRGSYPVSFSEGGRIVLAGELEVPVPRRLAGSLDLAREVEPAGPCTLFAERTQRGAAGPTKAGEARGRRPAGLEEGGGA